MSEQWARVLYGCETWTFRREEIDRLEALEMWLWRSLEKIKWQERISNNEVLSIVDETRCLIRTIGERKKNWIGHVLRGNGPLRVCWREECWGTDRKVDQGWK